MKLIVFKLKLLMKQVIRLSSGGAWKSDLDLRRSIKKRYRMKDTLITALMKLKKQVDG